MLAAAWGRPDEAYQALDRLPLHLREASEGVACQAAVAYELGSDVGLAEAARRVSKLAPGSPEAASTAGRAASARGDWKAAEEAFREAWSLAPGCCNAAGIGHALVAAGRRAEAGEWIARVQSVSPGCSCRLARELRGSPGP